MRDLGEERVGPPSGQSLKIRVKAARLLRQAFEYSRRGRPDGWGEPAGRRITRGKRRNRAERGAHSRGSPRVEPKDRCAHTVSDDPTRDPRPCPPSRAHAASREKRSSRRCATSRPSGLRLRRTPSGPAETLHHRGLCGTACPRERRVEKDPDRACTVPSPQRLARRVVVVAPTRRRPASRTTPTDLAKTARSPTPRRIRERLNEGRQGPTAWKPARAARCITLVRTVKKALRARSQNAERTQRSTRGAPRDALQRATVHSPDTSRSKVPPPLAERLPQARAQDAPRRSAEGRRQTRWRRR